MQYIPHTFKNLDNIIKEYQVNSLLAKVIDFNQYDTSVISNMISNRLVYHDFSLFEDADITLDRITEAIENNEKICIYGDYDCDGIMATTILVQTFKELGVEVGYHIPNRFTDGYGLNVSRVKQMAEKGYSLIITVDNGITAFDAIETANDLGIDVIVTDHHALKEELPDACSIIHTQVSYDYPFKDICGAFVAYKLAGALLQHHDKYLYTLASIATLSDVMPLLDENRSLVQRGLMFMNQQHFEALELLAGNHKGYTTQLLNFNVIPKINSVGRLPEYCNPNILVKYFLKDCDTELRMQISKICDEINQKRKNLTSQSISEIPYNEESFVYYSSTEIHRGIVGLIAGRMTSTYHIPAFIMYHDIENKQYIGSCRSIKGYSIKDLFMTHEDLFITSGGHDVAGGFTIEESEYDHFKQVISDDLKTVYFDDSVETIPLDSNDLTISNIESLDVLQPFGNSNPEPLFEMNKAEVLSKQLLSEGKHLKLHCKFHTVEFDALYFNIKNKEIPDDIQQTVRLIGHLNINQYRNIKNINFIIQDML